MTPRQWKAKLDVRLREDAPLAALYSALARGEWREVLALGATQFRGAQDRFASIEAMLDAIEQLISDAENEDLAPLRALEKSLRAERTRLQAAGLTSDTYRCFLESSFKGT